MRKHDHKCGKGLWLDSKNISLTAADNFRNSGIPLLSIMLFDIICIFEVIKLSWRRVFFHESLSLPMEIRQNYCWRGWKFLLTRQKSIGYGKSGSFSTSFDSSFPKGILSNDFEQQPSRGRNKDKPVYCMHCVSSKRFALRCMNVKRNGHVTLPKPLLCVSEDKTTLFQAAIFKR